LNEDDELEVGGGGGEVWIGGIGVGGGYVNEGELRKKVLRGDGLFRNEGMYGRGDVVRWVGDGRIDYLGRMEDEVKIRG
ncbi:AMP-binding protein, partial [Bacillus sp. WP8]|uniref:AMP-binding protein n=1 Tax=Bacillus sp. WP8 TaxID=756828 RepID=UPI0011A2F411